MVSAGALIQSRIGVLSKRSSFYETAPWGVVDQPAYLNQVLEVSTQLQPEEVLRYILEIEHELGRVRYERWGARVIDIDLLYFGDDIRDTARLTLPHPRLHERKFVLIPMVEIAPDFIHPLFQKSQATLLSDCTDTGEVSRLA
jgi:2-amino-4-hydroxy-6-hydroxymethyldihydropteridine diphosphokinase